MNVLFLSISKIPPIEQHSISLDLIHAFLREGHKVYVVGALERRENAKTYLSEEMGCQVLRVKTGNNKKANLIEKGITTLMLPKLYLAAIKRFFSDVTFDLVLYPTPPITHCNTVRCVKKKHNARTYLLLKDIFPQNAVDLGMMSKRGLKAPIYRYFRRMEKKLYAVSDHIGCMSQANVDYILRNNPQIDPTKVEICPNSVEVQDVRVMAAERDALRTKYAIPLNKKVFVYGGNLGKPQGIPFIMECVKSQRDNPDAFFLIVGDGTEYKKLENWFAENEPKNMKLMKRLPKEDYDRLVAACDVGLIFLDHRFTIPNFPSRLLAYMQAGIPVLACTDPNTDIGKVITEGGFGWHCQSNDVEAFDAQIGLALAADLQTMGEKGFAYLQEHYTVQRSYSVIINEKIWDQ